MKRRLRVAWERLATAAINLIVSLILAAMMVSGNAGLKILVRFSVEEGHAMTTVLDFFFGVVLFGSAIIITICGVVEAMVTVIRSTYESISPNDDDYEAE